MVFQIRQLVVVLVILFLASCTSTRKQIGIPDQVQSTIDTVSEDIAAGNDEKIYLEAAEEWRQASTLDQTKEFFKTMRTKLGKVKSRVFHVARGEQNTGVLKSDRSYVVQYQTSFEHADGMETFTLVERHGNWLLVRYFVNSEGLK